MTRTLYTRKARTFWFEGLENVQLGQADKHSGPDFLLLHSSTTADGQRPSNSLIDRRGNPSEMSRSVFAEMQGCRLENTANGGLNTYNSAMHEFEINGDANRSPTTIRHDTPSISHRAYSGLSLTLTTFCCTVCFSFTCIGMLKTRRADESSC
ncbi:hypothetical protein K469DRAFT_112905 [Zopfia rhizophila CBS 207.26]|uniref:Uncharacterized protein n=1 Tax=Zopfia rhizophila CBS 207.26 TaxID=1314779 RepID=A0A6A6E632_9PEZI|nr:hypothetical protein K469DRAFT_112905 [Zopfia rhizophila CBS 207.26]